MVASLDLDAVILDWGDGRKMTRMWHECDIPCHGHVIFIVQDSLDEMTRGVGLALGV